MPVAPYLMWSGGPLPLLGALPLTATGAPLSATGAPLETEMTARPWWVPGASAAAGAVSRGRFAVAPPVDASACGPSESFR